MTSSSFVSNPQGIRALVVVTVALLVGAIIVPDQASGSDARVRPTTPCDVLRSELSESVGLDGSNAVALNSGFLVQRTISADAQPDAIYCWERYSDTDPDIGAVEAVALADSTRKTAWLVLGSEADPAVDYGSLVSELGYEPGPDGGSSGIDFWQAATVVSAAIP